jgi:predicted small secreted protein/urease beta subunit
MEKKLLAIIALVMLASLSIAGCTSSTTNTSAGSRAQYNAVTYANAYLNDNIKPAFLGETIVSSKVLENGSNGATLSVVIHNTTSYNITTTVNLNIQQFSSVNDATTFFNNLSSGYTLGMPSSTAAENPASAAYQDTTGHAPTVSNSGYMINGEQISTITQQGEFVTWGVSSFN